jgi:hypothetical protein
MCFQARGPHAFGTPRIPVEPLRRQNAALLLLVEYLKCEKLSSKLPFC